MISVSTMINAPPEKVFAVLADGWLYGLWVVGATHIRDVDEGWPAQGTRIHHSVGPWPLVAHDVTKVTQADPPRSLELSARLWPLGTARIRLELEEIEPGRTAAQMSEEAVGGPARFLPRPVQAMLLRPRNRESLARLRHLATGRTGSRLSDR